MAKAYFIGGTPRVGKTTLTIKTLHRKAMMAASTDALRYTLRQVLSKDEYPDLFYLGKYTSNDPERREYIRDHPENVIDIQNKESAIVWKSVNNFVKSNLEDGFDILIEGIAILPELLSKVDYEYQAIFLGNQSESHYDRILTSARKRVMSFFESIQIVPVLSIEMKRSSPIVAVAAGPSTMSMPPAPLPA